MDSMLQRIQQWNICFNTAILQRLHKYKIFALCDGRACTMPERISLILNPPVFTSRAPIFLITLSSNHECFENVITLSSNHECSDNFWLLFPVIKNDLKIWLLFPVITNFLKIWVLFPAIMNVLKIWFLFPVITNINRKVGGWLWQSEWQRSLLTTSTFTITALVWYAVEEV